MKQRTKWIYRAAVTIIVMVLVFIIGSWAWLSFGKISPVQEKIYSFLPFPAAVVNGRAISIKQYISRYHQAQAFVQKSAQGTNANLKSAVFQRLLEETKLKIIAEQKNVPATDSQINKEYAKRQENFSSIGQGDLKQTLKQYGIDEKTYKNELLRANVTAANLTVWFYSQRSLNSQAYAKADEILEKLKLGQSMEVLAKAYSQDQQSKNMGGDLGYLEINQILPELELPLQNMAVGQSQILPTRYGLEIIKIEGRDNQGTGGFIRYHLRQIFLSGGDFNGWYGEQTKNFKIIKIINI